MSIRDFFHNGIDGLVLYALFQLCLMTSCLATLPHNLLLRMQRLSRRHHANCLAAQLRARRILRHACPISASSAPGSDVLLELFAGYAEQLQMLLGILENALLQRNLGGRIDREDQWNV